MSPVLLATCTRLPDGDEHAEALVSASRACGVQPQWAASVLPSGCTASAAETVATAIAARA